MSILGPDPEEWEYEPDEDDLGDSLLGIGIMALAVFALLYIIVLWW
jgi:hypothetical protein